MPLQTLSSTSKAVAADLTALAPSFLVVYASLKPDTGLSWCGDCRDAEPLVEKHLGGLDREIGVVYAGLPVEWRKPENPWRQAPFSVEKLPTVIKVTKDGKWERLVEGDVYDEKKLIAFIGNDK